MSTPPKVSAADPYRDAFHQLARNSCVGVWSLARSGNAEPLLTTQRGVKHVREF